jgi:hypothetical protein
MTPIEMASIREEEDMNPSKSKWWSKHFCGDVDQAVRYRNDDLAAKTRSGAEHDKFICLRVVVLK